MIDKRYDSGTRWEREICYSRVVRRGNYVCVSGTTAMDGDDLIGLGDVSRQAEFIFSKIAQSLQQVGAELTDVMRTRMYITDASHAAAVTEAHAASFAGINPCATLVIVRGFIDERLLVEVEVDAVVG